MPNLRIVHDNAISRAVLTASSAAAGFPVSNLQSDKKSNVWRATGKTARLDAKWDVPEPIGAVALPFCDLSPTATMRVRVATEGVATNLATYSEQIENAVYTKANIDATATAAASNTMLAPDGTMTGDKFISATGAATSRYLDTLFSGILDNVNYSGSWFFKRGEFPRVRLEVFNKAGTPFNVELNFDDGRVTKATPGASVNAKHVGNGWYRLMVNGVNMQTGAATPRLRAVLIPHMNASGSAWANTGVSPTVDTTVASPAPGWTVDKMMETAVTSGHYVSQSIYTTPGKTVVLEQYMKALSGTPPTRYGALILVGGSGLAVTHNVMINLSTGAVVFQTSNPQFSNLSVTDAGNGWWKVQVEFTPLLTGSTQWQIRLSNASNGAASSHLGDVTAGMYVCQPYAWYKNADNTSGLFSGSSSGDAVGDGVSGTYGWGRQFEQGDVCTSYYKAVASAATRPLGYMDAWQSYDYDSGWVLACPAPALRPRGWTAQQAASAYAYGGGACARHWLPAAKQAYALAVDINDQDNLLGAVEAACFVAGPVWSPMSNAASARLSMIDTTELYRTDAGDQLADAGTVRRKVSIDLTVMSPDDRSAFTTITRNSRAYPVLLSAFPESADLQLERDYMIYGRRTRDAEIATVYARAYSTTDEFEEI